MKLFKFGQLVQEMSFKEKVYSRPMDAQQTFFHNNSPRVFGSGELKIYPKRKGSLFFFGRGGGGGSGYMRYLYPANIYFSPDNVICLLQLLHILKCTFKISFIYGSKHYNET